AATSIPRPPPAGSCSVSSRRSLSSSVTSSTSAQWQDWQRRVRGVVAAGGPRVMTKPKLKVAMTMMADRDNAARDVATQLGVSLSTLYAYVDAKGEPRPRAAELLGKRSIKPAP